MVPVCPYVRALTILAGALCVVGAGDAGAGEVPPAAESEEQAPPPPEEPSRHDLGDVTKVGHIEGAACVQGYHDDVDEGQRNGQGQRRTDESPSKDSESQQCERN